MSFQFISCPDTPYRSYKVFLCLRCTTLTPFFSSTAKLKNHNICPFWRRRSLRLVDANEQIPTAAFGHHRLRIAQAGEGGRNGGRRGMQGAEASKGFELARLNGIIEIGLFSIWGQWVLSSHFRMGSAVVFSSPMAQGKWSLIHRDVRLGPYPPSPTSTSGHTPSRPPKFWVRTHPSFQDYV